MLDQAQSPSSGRKRARLEDELADSTEVVQQLQVSSVVNVRDDTYYLSDGSCVIRVQNTLFNVHRSVLSKDDSTFSAMFELPVAASSSGPEGSSDDNPIVLTGDTVQEFRNFLWGLYALPHELSAVHSADADLAQLMDIARVSNKYSFNSIETWALDAIRHYVNRTPSPLFSASPYTIVCGSEVKISSSGAQISQLLRLAQMCSHEPLLSAIISLLTQCMPQSIQLVFLAMSLADELDLRVLRGVAYAEMLRKEAYLTLRSGQGSTDGLTVDRLLVVSPQQQLRLLTGYYRLSRVWERLQVRPFDFRHAVICAVWQARCMQSWLEFWKEKAKCDNVVALGLADVVGRLKAMAKELDREGVAPSMHDGCRHIARKAMLEMIKEFEETLPDYFGGGYVVEL
ncbi:hypothetical protein B0H21DRAFT_821784 [Amylocystis lapponica]|nr:hypothetical protein B0H21DRAFT_821784 [Amylocystis lapponica]